MKAIKRRLAVVLAVLLMIPAQPVMAVEALPDGIVTEREDAGYDVTAGEEDFGEDASTEDVADVENEASGDEADSEDADAAGAEEGMDTETESGDAETSKDAADTEVSGKDGDLEADQDAVDSEASEDEDEPETGGDLEDGKDPADAEDSEEDVVSGGNENPDAGKDDADLDVEEDAGNSGKGDGSENDTDIPEGQKPSEDSDSEDKSVQMDDEILEEELADMELLLDDLTLASPSNLAKISAVAEDEVKFNTGNHVFSVVSREDFFDRELGDAFFDEDGSYTINIPEANPFFPYEVQFTYDGKESREWFMTPDDTVEVGGHEFRVSAYFDGTVVTQMSMKVGGDVVVAYPDEKEFTDEADGADPTSLLPLEERTLNFDFTGYTPVELTMISLDEIFVGDNALGSGDKVLWTDYGDDYTINMSSDLLDLSYYTSDRLSDYPFMSWEMIIGDDNQLAANNIRYNVILELTKSTDWLIPSVYIGSSSINRKEIDVLSYYYGDSWDEEHRELFIYVPSEQMKEDEAYVGLTINKSLFPDMRFDSFKFYSGDLSLEEYKLYDDITDWVFNSNMEERGGTILITTSSPRPYTMITFNSEGNVTGRLTIRIALRKSSKGNPISHTKAMLQGLSQGKRVDVVDSVEKNIVEGCHNIIFTLYNEYAVEEKYFLRLSSDDIVSAAYVGNYVSKDDAIKNGDKDIKNDLFMWNGNIHNDIDGYATNYSDGVHFTIFMDEGGRNDQDIYHYYFQVKGGSNSSPINRSTFLDFGGINDQQGKMIESYQINSYQDSYGSKNYKTFLVNENVDLTRLAPIFTIPNGSKLYTLGSGKPEVSGETYHDFSKGAVQYTVSAANGIDSKNYWLQVVQVGNSSGKLYINSLADESSNTKIEDGVIYSTREMFIPLSGEHDILLMNIGKDPIPAISAELISDEVELDSYWTLKGDYALQGIDATGGSSPLQAGELWNQAKVRIKVKDEVEKGREISGTLTFKSGNRTLMVLNLTGYVGGPGITTETVKPAVKYVPYGTMIQNNNKYSWNTTSYEIVSGKLPAGMEMKSNGELYGIPKETGSFTFTVRLNNSHDSFTSDSKTFTLTVTENSDANVESAADPGYELTQRVQNMTLSATADQTLVSKGNYDEFVALYLDGEKLTEGTDYTSEAGSTRITIRGETLKKSNTPGKHTLGLEFRTKDTNTLKRVAQNYEITTTSTSGSNSSGSGGSSSGSTTSSIRDPKKGYMDANSGIITGSGDGYSNWKQDENGWKLVYADGTVAAGYMAEQSDGTTVEQIIWEKVNGAWYAFGVNEYLKSGWVFDYQFGSWYWVSVDKGMQSGWYTDTQDGFTYYMDPATGKLAAGWKQIDEKWYYFNGISVSPTWVFDEKTGTWFYNVLSRRKPYGAMFKNEETPDGYFVNEDGAWDGKEK